MHPSFLKLCVRQGRDRKVVEQSPRPMDPVDLSDSGHWRRQAAVIASPFALGSELGRVVTRTFVRRRDADAWAHQVEHDRTRGVAVDPRHGQITLADYAAKWLVQRSDLRPTTRAKYQWLLDSHVLPALGKEELGRLTPSGVRGWYMSLRAERQVTADDAYRLLRAVFNTALADELIVASPSRIKGAAQVRSPERPTASVAELAAAAEAVPARYRAAVLLLAWCQLRRGEVLALQRRDVDVDSGTIRIERAWSAPMSQPLQLGVPKTEAGVRTLAVPANVLPALRNRLAHHVGPEPEAWLLAVRHRQRDGDFAPQLHPSVGPGSAGGRAARPSST